MRDVLSLERGRSVVDKVMTGMAVAFLLSDLSVGKAVEKCQKISFLT